MVMVSDDRLAEIRARSMEWVWTGKLSTVAGPDAQWLIGEVDRLRAEVERLRALPRDPPGVVGPPEFALIGEIASAPHLNETDFMRFEMIRRVATKAIERLSAPVAVSPTTSEPMTVPSASFPEGTDEVVLRGGSGVLVVPGAAHRSEPMTTKQEGQQ